MDGIGGKGSAIQPKDHRQASVKLPREAWAPPLRKQLSHDDVDLLELLRLLLASSWGSAPGAPQTFVASSLGATSVVTGSSWDFNLCKCPRVHG